MIASSLKNIKIAGVASAVPTKKVKNTDYYPLFGQSTVNKIIMTTEVNETYHVHEKQTAGDLAYAAAEHLIKSLNIDVKTIGFLVFVVTYPDYFVPATANIIQKRLELSTDCVVFDLNLACSGFVIGLQTLGSLLSNSNSERALLLIGDSTSKVVSSEDKSRLLFGDAGAAVLLEKSIHTEDIKFGVKNDGSKFKSIIVPAGGFRNPTASNQPELWSDGNIRTDYNLFMDGTNVFSFAMTDVPALIKDFLEFYQTDINAFDGGVFHQPNAFILKHLAKKISLPLEKLPLSLDRYGNTSGASIPMTMCDAYGQKSQTKLNLLLCGFGVGLSWAVCNVKLDTSVIFPIFHTDDFFKEGVVSKD